MLFENSAYWYEIEKIEFTFDKIHKVYPSEEVKYENGVFRIRFLQKDTKDLNFTSKIQARVVYTNGDVLPTEMTCDNVFQTLSKTEI